MDCQRKLSMQLLIMKLKDELLILGKNVFMFITQHLLCRHTQSIIFS